MSKSSKTKSPKPHFKHGEPTVRGRAAVIHSELTVKFLSKEQCDLFVRDLVAQESYPNFSVETQVGDSLTPDVYHVTLHEICWAHNLTAVAKLLEKYDYGMDRS